MGWLGDFNDPINFLEMFRDAEGGNNDTGWENAEFKKLLDESAKETDTRKAYRIIEKTLKQFSWMNMPVTPIYFYTHSWVQNENLKDVVVSGLGDVQLKWAYFE